MSNSKCHPEAPKAKQKKKKRKFENLTMELNELPTEVLEHVFANIPGLDLMRTMRRVCRRWNDIIVRRRFQPWKKSYFRYKVGENGRKLIEESDDEEEPPKKKKKKEPSLQQDLDWKIEELKKAMSNVANVWNEKINPDQYLHPAKNENGIKLFSQKITI